MPITDPQVVRWSNERARTLADRITALNAALVAYRADYAAQSIAAQITAAGASEVVDDGSAVDGRSPVTGTQLQNMAAALTQLDTALNTTLVSGVGTTVQAVLNGIQVNGSIR